MDIGGKINGTGGVLAGNLTLSGRRGTDYENPGASEWSALSGVVTKSIPQQGYDVDGGPQGWTLYTAYSQNTDLPSSMSGADTLSENDMWQTNLDDLNTRFGHQTSIYDQSGEHYSGDVGRAEYIACFTVCGDEVAIGGAYSVAAIDLHTAATREPRIVSATPSAPVYSVTVDDVMSLSHGGRFAGVYGYVGGELTAAITAIRAVSAQGRSLKVSELSGTFAGQRATKAYIARDMYVFDMTHPAAVPPNTQINEATGGFVANGVPKTTSLTLSSDTQIESGDDLLFARGEKAVELNGHPYIVVGITLPRARSHAGIVYFSSPVSPTDARRDALIVPNAHTIWMWEGTDGEPAYARNDIAFNRAGTVTLGCNRAVGCDGLSVAGSLGVSGAVRLQVRVVSNAGRDAALPGDYVVAWNSGTAGQRTELLPRCDARSKGRILVIKDESHTAGTRQPIVVSAAAGTVEERHSVPLITPGASATLCCDGSGNWMML